MFSLRGRIARRFGFRCVERGATVRGNVELGAGVYVGRGCQIIARNSERVVIGDNTFLFPGTMLLPYGGSIVIGRNVSINPYTVIYGHGGTEIGDDVLIATSCVLIPANHIYSDPEVLIRLQGATARGIRIENDVWLGARVVVVDGVTIGRGSVIGAGSVVTKNVAPFSVAVGAPARVIKQRGEAADKRLDRVAVAAKP